MSIRYTANGPVYLMDEANNNVSKGGGLVYQAFSTAATSVI